MKAFLREWGIEPCDGRGSTRRGFRVCVGGMRGWTNPSRVLVENVPGKRYTKAFIYSMKAFLRRWGIEPCDGRGSTRRGFRVCVGGMRGWTNPSRVLVENVPGKRNTKSLHRKDEGFFAWVRDRTLWWPGFDPQGVQGLRWGYAGLNQSLTGALRIRWCL